MKKLIVVLCASAIFTQAFAMRVKDDEVPTAVMNAFRAKYPEAKHDCWSMEKGASAYTVKFKDHGEKHAALFDQNGTWKETAMCVKKSELPAPVQTTLNSQFDDYKVKKPEMVIDPKHGTCYEAELKKGDEKWDVTLTPEGKIIEKTMMDDDRDKMSENRERH
jgi:hypothetical protein